MRQPSVSIRDEQPAYLNSDISGTEDRTYIFDINLTSIKIQDFAPQDLDLQQPTTYNLQPTTSGLQPSVSRFQPQHWTPTPRLYLLGLCNPEGL